MRLGRLDRAYGGAHCRGRSRPARRCGAALAIAVALLLCGPAAGGRPVRVKLATLAPKGTSYHHALLAMGEKWRAAPDGPVALTVYADGVLGGEVDMVRRMRIGQIQAAMLTTGGLAEIDGAVGSLQNMPMMFRSLDELNFVRSRLQADLEQRFEDKGFVVLFWGDAGWLRFFSRRPALFPEDFKRMKMFAWAGDAKVIDLWKAAGYRPVPLAVTDILIGLQTGLIDTVCCTPSYALAGQFDGPAPHMLDLRWAPLVGATVILRKIWDALSPRTQRAMAAAAAEAAEEIRRSSRRENAQSIEAMKKRGLVVHPVTDQIEAVWRAAAEQAYPKIRGSVVRADMFDRVQALLRQYRGSGTRKMPKPAGAD